MRRRQREFKRTKIEIIPMIDTMFFLLVFFLLSSLNIINLESIGLNLPKEEASLKTPMKIKAQPMVTITNDGSIFVDKVSTQPDQVGSALIKAANADALKESNGKSNKADLRTLSVVISAEPKATYGLVVTCIDSAKQQGIERFAIAVDQSLLTGPVEEPVKKK